MELKHRSKVVVEGDERAAHRAYLRNLGLSDEEMSKPFIGIINSWGEFHPGHIVLRSFAEEVKKGVLAVGFFLPIGLWNLVGLGLGGVSGLPAKDR